VITVDHDESRMLVIAAEDGHRTTLTLGHEDGVQLLQELTEYYGRLEYGHGTDEQAKRKGLLEKLIDRFLPHKRRTPR